MKKNTYLTLLGMLICMSVNAQGIMVTYKTEPKMESIDISVDNPAIAEAIRSQMAAGMTTIRYLLYNNGESIYRSKVNSTDEAMPEQASSGITIVVVNNDNSLYKNQKENRQVAQEYIMDKAFLITEKLNDFGWVLSNEKKEVAGYSCNKAISKDGNVTAWYCAAIPVNDGPYVYWGLPGVILQVETAAQLITATEVNRATSMEQIQVPTSGKKVAREEFEKTREKKMKEMSEISGGGSDVKIDIIKP